MMQDADQTKTLKKNVINSLKFSSYMYVHYIIEQLSIINMQKVRQILNVTTDIFGYFNSMNKLCTMLFIKIRHRHNVNL